mgnify:CR=1 FL=1
MSIRNLTENNNIDLICNELTQNTSYDVIDIVENINNAGSLVNYSIVEIKTPCYITRYRDLFTFSGSVNILTTNTGGYVEIDVKIPFPEPYNSIQNLKSISGWTFTQAGSQFTNGFITQLTSTDNVITLKYHQIADTTPATTYKYQSQVGYRLEYTFRGQCITI